MTEIERYEPKTDTLELAPRAWSLAQRIAKTEFVPGSLRGKPEAVLACILAGNEVGVSPMTSLAKIHVVDGRPAMAAELMRAIVLREGHEFWIEEQSSTRCTVGGQRKGSERQTTVTWTLDDAERANLKGKNNWKSYPSAMLLARATAALCRAIFPDVLAGISYTLEELQDGDVIDVSELPEADSAPAPPASTSKAKARQAATRGADTPDKTEPDPEPPVEREEPPLPGEDDDDVVDAELVEDEYEGEDQHLEGDGPRLSGPQVVAMRFADRGITDRDRRLEIAGGIIGRTIESTKELEPDEISAVLEYLNDDDRFPELDKTAESDVSPDSAPRTRRRRIDEDPRPSSPPASPTDWTGEDWRTFLNARSVKVSEVLKEASKLARENEQAAPGTLDDLVGHELGPLLVGFVEDLALSRKGPS